MGELEDLVLGLLRSSEELKTVLETQSVSQVDPVSSASTTGRLEDDGNKRILAVVSHQDDWNVSEEGRCVSIFIF